MHIETDLYETKTFLARPDWDRDDRSELQVYLLTRQSIQVGCWLCWAYRPFETVFQSISGRLPERGRKKREMIAERKNVKRINKGYPWGTRFALFSNLATEQNVYLMDSP